MAVNEISGFLKYKDPNGDINLLMPITTKDNVDGLDEIEESLNSTIKFTAQSLTDDQKEQARSNINAASSWNDLDDRPFGEIPTGSDTLTWDGNTEGLVCVDSGSGSYWYLIAESAPTLDDFANGASYTYLTSGTESSANLELGAAIYEVGDGALVAGNTIIALKDGATMIDTTFPKKGIYFVWIGNDSYTTSLTIPDYNGFPSNKLLDISYLPSFTKGVITTGDGEAYTATVEGITELAVGLQFVMIPHTNSTTTSVTLNVNGLGAKLIRQRLSSNTAMGVVGATANWIVANKPVTVTYNGTAWVAELTRPDAANLYGTVPVANGGVPSAADASEGAFLQVVDGTPSWADIDLGSKIYTQNDEPTDAADGALWIDLDSDQSGSSTVDSIILRSSTEGSSKKFKLTIDDDGVLTTTEIVESTT